MKECRIIRLNICRESLHEFNLILEASAARIGIYGGMMEGLWVGMWRLSGHLMIY